MTTNATTRTSARTDFKGLGVQRAIARALARNGITEPTPIQAHCIPDVLAGRDVSGRAQTGSGKTLAFGIPLVQRIESAAKRRPKALVLAPTRELARQIVDALVPIAETRSVRTAAVYGGAAAGGQARSLHRGVDIVVATPGRLTDFLDRGDISLRDLQTVVIDEADQMADMGFLPQVRNILDRIDHAHQTLLFSATLDGSVGELVRRYQSDPVRHDVGAAKPSVEQMAHRFVGVEHTDKLAMTKEICASADRTLVFVRTKRGADRLAQRLKRQGIAAGALHGGHTQNRRERTLAAFAKGKGGLLVATDVAARGIHVDDVDLVLHYDPPADHKAYLHRSGRTARAGGNGLVVSLVMPDQRRDVASMQRELGVSQQIVALRPDDRRIANLADWEPPETEPKPDDNRRRAGGNHSKSGGRQQRNRRRRASARSAR